MTFLYWKVRTGMRVAAQFRDDRRGAITDVYFVPEADAKKQTIKPGDEPVTITEHLIGVTMSEPMYPHRERFAKGLLEGRTDEDLADELGSSPLSVMADLAFADDLDTRFTFEISDLEAARSP